MLIGIVAVGALIGQIKAGRLRALAAMSEKRFAIFPDVPTANELGYRVTLDMWRGIAVPKGVPRPTIAKLQDAIKHVAELAKR